MSRSVLAIFLFIGFASVGKAQTVPSAANNYLTPFSSLQFANSYKDTVTLNATYLGESGGSGLDNTLTLKQISKLHGLNISRFQNAMAFYVDGFKQRFYMPYRSDNESMLASAKPNTKVLLKCIVYRFFTIDGITNFFCVDKVKV